MPTLLQINSVVNTGSTGRIVEQLSQYILSKGWKSYIAYGRKSNKSDSHTLRIGGEKDIILHGIKSRVLDGHGLGSVAATKALLAVINNIHPDIIHLHNIHGYYINYPILFEYLDGINIPIIWTLHDCWPITGHCSHFADIDCLKWKIECHHCPKKTNYPSSLFFDRSRNNYKFKRHFFTLLDNLMIVPVSYWLGSIVQESYLAIYPMQVINNGIDLNSFNTLSNYQGIRHKYGIGDRFMLIAVASAWGVNKGLHDYYKLSQNLSSDYVIVLVGLSKKQRKLLPSNIIGIEKTENLKELAGLYSTASIVLNLSYEETFGMTTIEGFACGTPGIVYNCTASPELITAETGIVVEPGNIAQVVNAIKGIKANGKEFYSTNCRKRAERFFDKEERYMEYLKLYKNMLTSNQENQ